MASILAWMNLSEPTQIVTPTLDGPVLAVLGRAETPLTGREVSRLARRGSSDGVRRVLHRLTAQGIALARDQGGAVVYQLNREHIGAEAILSLVDLSRLLLERVRVAIEAWTFPPIHASLFGSFARGEAGPDSDIDVLLVRRGSDREAAWDEDLAQLIEDTWKWTGNSLVPTQFTQGELRRGIGAPLITEVRLEAVHLAGEPLDRLLARLRARG